MLDTARYFLDSRAVLGVCVPGKSLVKSRGSFNQQGHNGGQLRTGEALELWEPRSTHRYHQHHRHSSLLPTGTQEGQKLHHKPKQHTASLHPKTLTDVHSWVSPMSSSNLFCSKLLLFSTSQQKVSLKQT